MISVNLIQYARQHVWFTVMAAIFTMAMAARLTTANVQVQD